MIIVSCGILNFEESNLSNGKSHEFAKWFYDKYGERFKPWAGFLTTAKDAKKIFETSFRMNFPEVCNVIIVDCSTIKADPGDDSSLTGRTGRHYKTVENLVDHVHFTRMNMPLQDIRPDQKILVINACVHGRHRSVANKECQFKVFHAGCPTGREVT